LWYSQYEDIHFHNSLINQKNTDTKKPMRLQT
jgi:hypothetical protein